MVTRQGAVELAKDKVALICELINNVSAPLKKQYFDFCGSRICNSLTFLCLDEPEYEGKTSLRNAGKYI
jgi:hypothetical protein